MSVKRKTQRRFVNPAAAVIKAADSAAEPDCLGVPQIYIHIWHERLASGQQRYVLRAACLIANNGATVTEHSWSLRSDQPEIKGSRARKGYDKLTERLLSNLCVTHVFTALHWHIWHHRQGTLCSLMSCKAEFQLSESVNLLTRVWGSTPGPWGLCSNLCACSLRSASATCT